MDLGNAKHFKESLSSEAGKEISNLKHKPCLPPEIQLQFPVELVRLIHSYVPNYEKKSPKSSDPSPNLQRELTKIQNMKLRGSSPTYMYNLDDFLLE